MNPYDIVRLGPTTMHTYSSFQLQQKILNLQLEVMTLRDLLRQLDPEHMYVFNQEYQAFIRTRVPEDTPEEKGSGIYAGAIISQGTLTQGGPDE
jgi:hypothetical protein